MTGARHSLGGRTVLMSGGGRGIGQAITPRADPEADVPLRTDIFR